MAAFTALKEIAQTNLAAAAALAAGWIALYVLMHYGDSLEQFVCLAAAFATMIAGGIVAKAYAADLSMSEAALRLLIVGAVMTVLATVNLTMVLLRRSRNSET